jgi:excinuclease ABC subunit C
LCPGVCTGEITQKEYSRTINHIRLFFEGKKTALLKTLEKEMAQYAKKQEFEKAGEIKHTLFALNHIQDVALIKADNQSAGTENFRIEAYDIAHLSGKDMTGAMIVLENGHLDKSEYRKFKIKTVQGANDVGALREVLKRRFAHTEWQMPNILVVDGNEVQKRAAEDVLREIFSNTPDVISSVAVVAVVKDERHKPKGLIGKSDIVEKYQKEILLANNEAHRFVIAYHKKLRSNFLR